ncbi:PREDICTED: uncharacterized protein LOC108559691 [Nicrophorus vespilloides]|uniref:Uncharacterized protein LOC108559691 n=1 Tax=Nicrophorus vespilloides TaxID=110193 RepID=A0ABM1MD77_NICVS|nr:PREDICTED: uncharacterized protein LOC108559691 [Nicrophorus vespilloides]
MQFHLNILANFILAEYFDDSRCVLIFSDNNRFDFDGVLGAIQITVNNATFDPDVIFHKYFGCQGMLVNVDNPATMLNEIEYQIQHHQDRFNKRRYLFIPTETQEEDMFDIFNLTAIEFIADMLIIKEKPNFVGDIDKWGFDEDFVLQLYTHRFVGYEDTNERVLIDEWYSRNQSFLQGNYLYPEKIYNGYGRKFRIATFHYKPYAIPETKEGTELRLAVEYSLKHNLTSELVIDDVGEWGEIYDNWTGYGTLGNVLMDKAEVGLASICTWYHEYHFLDLSKPLVRTGVTCLTPAPTLAGGWLVPLFPFTYDMWIAVIFSFMACSVVLFLLEYYKARGNVFAEFRAKKMHRYRTGSDIIQESFLLNTAVYLLQPIRERERVKGGNGKYIYGAMFIFSLLIASGYSSGLASSLTVPRYVGAIRTVQDLVDSGIQWGATSIVWILTIIGAPEYNDVMLVKQFVIATAETLKKQNNKRFAFAVERLPGGYYAIGDYITEEGVKHLRLMTEDVYWDHCVSLARKSSIWLPSYDEYTLRLAQTGIAQVWEHKIVITHLNAKIQKTVKHFSQHEEQNTEPVKLTLGHVEGTFVIWTLGTFTSIVVFVVELWVDRIAKKKLVTEFHND